MFTKQSHGFREIKPFEEAFPFIDYNMFAK